MKIAFVNDTFLQGRGVDQVIFELARRIGKRHEVDVITTEHNFPEENFRIKRVKGGKLVTGGVKDFLFFRNFPSFRNAAKGYDVVNLHHSTLNPAFFGFKNVVVTYHGFPFVWLSERGLRKIGRSVVNRVGRKSLRFGRRVVSISKYLKKELIAHGVPEHKIVVIHDGVDEIFRPTWNDRNYMLFVGRHEKHKNVDELIRISGEVGFPLKIAGEGPETENLKKLAKRLEAEVEFLGNVERKELVRLYQNSSFFISASKWEGFGLIFLEAAACGKPSVGYETCAIPEVVLNGKTGLLARNYEELKGNAKRLIEDKGLRKTLGKNAFTFSKNFSWERVSRAYERLFEEIISSSRKRPL
ncbi:MAG: glycosyltransferase family 4 protein [Candidatus Syntropharchaeia archaeon]